jgi:serine protease Do
LVVALGHPWGVVGAAAAGVVIGIGSWWPEAPKAGREWIVAGMRLRPGNSGGPLLDAEGQLVGMNTMISGPEVGMAVPVHVVKRFLHKALGNRQAGS